MQTAPRPEHSFGADVPLETSANVADPTGLGQPFKDLFDQLAAQIRAIKDPSSTLPVPIPVDMATSKKVTVQGVEGIFVGDSTGLGSAVIWQKDGIVYGVAGTLTEQQVLAVANSLH